MQDDSLSKGKKYGSKTLEPLFLDISQRHHALSVLQTVISFPSAVLTV